MQSLVKKAMCNNFLKRKIVSFVNLDLKMVRNDFNESYSCDVSLVLKNLKSSSIVKL